MRRLLIALKLVFSRKSFFIVSAEAKDVRKMCSGEVFTIYTETINLKPYNEIQICEVIFNHYSPLDRFLLRVEMEENFKNQ